MSHLSSRIKATMMEDGDFLSPTPLNTNSALLDPIVSVKQCTSTTRPLTPFEGQWIYETDTQVLRRWDSTTSKWYLRAGSASSNTASVGLILSTTSASAATLSNGAAAPASVAMITWSTPVSKNKTYKIVEDAWISLTGTGYNDTKELDYDIQSFATLTPPVQPIVAQKQFSFGTMTFSTGSMPVRRMFRRTWFYNVPNNAGSLTLYGGFYLFAMDQSKIAATWTFGKPFDAGVPARVRVYDCGLTVGN